MWGDTCDPVKLQASTLTEVSQNIQNTQYIYNSLLNGRRKERYAVAQKDITITGNLKSRDNKMRSMENSEKRAQPWTA